MRINATHLINEYFPPTGRQGKRPTNIRQFARAIDVDEISATKIYDGTTASIRFVTLENMCKVLNCSPLDILVSDDPQMQRLLAYQSHMSELQNNKKDGTD